MISATKLLERHSKILGFTNSKQDKKGKVLENILNKIDENYKFEVNNPEQYDKVPALKNWHEIKTFAIENRKNYQKVINDFSCYRQGGTNYGDYNKAYTILIYDIDRLYETFISKKEVSPIAGVAHHSLISDKRLSSITKQLNSEFKAFSNTFFEFEENLDEELSINIDNVIKLCRQNNIIPENMNLQNLKNIFDTIINNGNNELSKFSKLYKNFNKNIHEEELEKNIVNIAQLNTEDLFNLNRLIESLNSILDEIETKVELQKRVSGISGTTEIQNNLKKQISTNLNTLISLE